MRIQSQYRPGSLRALLGLVGCVFVLTVVGAEPLHLLEGRDIGVSVIPDGELAASTPTADARVAPPAGEGPFAPDHGDCLSCLALALSPQTAGAPSLFHAAPPAAPSVSPPLVSPAGHTKGMEARPRAPPAA